jgi:hypothetical protein
VPLVASEPELLALPAVPPIPPPVPPPVALEPPVLDVPVLALPVPWEPVLPVGLVVFAAGRCIVVCAIAMPLLPSAIATAEV